MTAGGRGAAALAAMALALAACGGGDEDSGPSKAEYVKQANAICSDNASEIESITELTVEGKKADAFEIRFFVEEIGPALEVLLLQLRQLEKPEEDVPDAERLISIYQRMAADAKEAAKSDRASAAFVKGLERRIELIDDASEAADMPNCGAPG